VHVHINVAEVFRLCAELAVTAAHQTKRSLSRFFHHFADMSRENDVALAWVAGCFDVQHLAASGGVSKAGYDTRFAGLEPRFAHVLHRAEHFAHHLRRDGDAPGFSARHLRRNTATDGGNLPLEFAHACLVCVIVDDSAKRFFLKLALLRLETVLFELPP